MSRQGRGGGGVVPLKGKKAKVMEDGREALIGRARQGEGGRNEKRVG